jgi:hypothetical protein
MLSEKCGCVSRRLSFQSASEDLTVLYTDRHKVPGSHWIAIQIQSRSCVIYYFDSYSLPPLIPYIQSFINRNCTVCDYNSVQLQGPITAVCDKYCCLYSLYADIDNTPQNFVGVVGTVDTDRRVSELFKAEFGSYPKCCRGMGNVTPA